MKFAKYWQKIDLTVNKDLFGRSDISVWGASNESIDAALLNAKERQAKLNTFIATGFEQRSSYEYGNGFIKEEVLEEVKSVTGEVLAVLTRNSYGATVLNTEQVLFGDIDITKPGLMARFLKRCGKRKKDQAYYLEKIKTFQKKHAELSIKVYATHSGLRFVVSNKIFSAEEREVQKIFTQLNVDPLYMRLCKQQHCFRARLTPKPWRINIARPSSRFPRATEQEKSDFEQWLKHYRLASSHKTATKVLATFGVEQHPDVRQVLELHDHYACHNAYELA